MMTEQYECTNCLYKYGSRQSWEEHKDGCTKRYKGKVPDFHIIRSAFKNEAADSREAAEYLRKQNMSGKNYDPKTRDALFQLIADRDGEWCIHCTFWPARDGPDKAHGELEIHHADNDTHNWNHKNIYLLCNKCNLEFRQYPVDTQLEMIRKDSVRNIYVMQERKKISNTELLINSIDYTNARPEAKINSRCQIRFRDFCLKEIDSRGPMFREALIDAGAEEVGCMPATGAQYLRKLTSYRGPLEATQTESGVIIMRREKHG